MPAAQRTLRRVGMPLLVGAVGLLATTYVALVDPDRPGHYPTCPVLALTGWACPGCGSLRAVHALAHADLGAALHRNPVTVLAAGVLVALYARWAVRGLRAASGGGSAAAISAAGVPGWLIWVVTGLLVGFGVLRNLPGVGWLGP